MQLSPPFGTLLKEEGGGVRQVVGLSRSHPVGILCHLGQNYYDRLQGGAEGRHCLPRYTLTLYGDLQGMKLIKKSTGQVGFR